MRGLYYPYYQTRLADVAAQIEPGTRVVDLCAGDCAIYRYQLFKKNVDYLACDNSPAFLRLARERGIAHYRLDVAEETQYPSADIVLMMASLYQFIPQHEADDPCGKKKGHCG
jgi:ubiquinone/menaquinone biosynthesis C-methylase UbiE